MALRPMLPGDRGDALPIGSVSLPAHCSSRGDDGSVGVTCSSGINSLRTLRRDVGLFKSAEEKSAVQARRAEKKFARSPVGQATAAHERGDALFQIALPVDESSALILSQIEAIGWHLENAGYTSEVSGFSTTNMNGVLDSVSITGQLTGVYLFRRS